MKLSSFSGAIMALAMSSTAAMAADCFQMGGVAIPNFFGEGDGQRHVQDAALMDKLFDLVKDVARQLVFCA